MSKMPVSEFLAYCDKLVDSPTVYVNGAFGAVASNYNKKRYKNAKNITRFAKIDACPSNGFFDDCCGVPKGIIGGWTGDTSKIYGGAIYNADNTLGKDHQMPDVNELGLIQRCSNVSTDFSQIIPGELVYMKGHCGIYRGNGIVIEATPQWDCGVQRTGLGNVGIVYGGKTRKWEKHGLLDLWIDYSSIPQPQPDGKYTIEDFRKDVRILLNANTNLEAFNKTIRISKKVNKHNNLVTPLERYMKAEGYYSGVIEADDGKQADFGGGMEKSVMEYQRKIVKLKKPDGVLDPQGATWRKLLLG